MHTYAHMLMRAHVRRLRVLLQARGLFMVRDLDLSQNRIDNDAAIVLSAALPHLEVHACMCVHVCVISACVWVGVGGIFICMCTLPYKNRRDQIHYFPTDCNRLVFLMPSSPCYPAPADAESFEQLCRWPWLSGSRCVYLCVCARVCVV